MIWKQQRSLMSVWRQVQLSRNVPTYCRFNIFSCKRPRRGDISSVVYFKPLSPTVSEIAGDVSLVKTQKPPQHLNMCKQSYKSNASVSHSRSCCDPKEVRQIILVWFGFIRNSLSYSKRCDWWFLLTTEVYYVFDLLDPNRYAHVLMLKLFYLKLECRPFAYFIGDITTFT